MKFFAVTVLGWVLVPFLALAQEKVTLNTVTGVKVKGSTVEITSTQKPNFTTFTMTDPPRLVIDISEAILKGVPEEMKGSGGLITGLRTANYGTDATAIARVLIGYDKDVETDIQVSDDNVLVVKVLDGTGPLVAQLDTNPQNPVQPATGPTATGTDDSAAKAAAAAQAEREAQEKAAAEAAAAAKLTEAERRKQEELARAEAAKRAEEERRAQELAAAEEKKRKEEEARAAAEARKLAEAEEKKRKLEEARAAAEARKLAEAEEKKRQAEEAEAKRLAQLEEKKRKLEEARAAAEARKQQEAEEKKRRAEEAEAKRLAQLEERKRKQEEARAAAEARKLEEAEERKRRAEEAEARRLAQLEEKKRREETRVASVETPRRAEPAEASSASTSERRKTLEIVGFQQQAGGSRVYVRTNEPVRYKVSERTNEIILELENTQIGKGNNTRALDTSFFDTAVSRVDPTVGPDRSVRVSIKLKEAVSVQTRQEGNTISLEFPRPGR